MIPKAIPSNYGKRPRPLENRRVAIYLKPI
jgi:hypothetical protein